MCIDLNLTNADTKISGSGEGVVANLFDQKMREWETAVRKESKIIAFRTCFQGALPLKQYREMWDNGKYKPYWKANTNSSSGQNCWEFCASDISSHDNPSIGMTIEWAVLNKIDVKGKISYTFLSGRRISTGWRFPDDYTIIDHTDERETYFLQLDESFANMIAKVHKALGDLSPEKLSMIADSKMKMLGQ